MKLEAAIKEYLIEIEIRKYTPKTIRGYKSNLYLFLHFIQKDTPEIDDLTLADVRRFTKYMVDRGNKGTYINGILKTLKSFIQYCYEEGYVKQTRPPPPRPLPEGEYIMDIDLNNLLYITPHQIESYYYSW